MYLHAQITRQDEAYRFLQELMWHLPEVLVMSLIFAFFQMKKRHK